MKHIVTIGGGEAAENIYNQDFLVQRSLYLQEMSCNPFEERKKNWKKKLADDLGDGYQIYSLYTPFDSAALYHEWKYVFEKTIAHFDKKISIVGHSLGAIFTLKYISEHGDASEKIKNCFLLGTPLHDSNYEVLGSFSIDVQELDFSKKLQQQMYFYASRDDTIVNFSDYIEYTKIFPHAHFREYHNLGHFIEVEKIPELLQDIQK